MLAGLAVSGSSLAQTKPSPTAKSQKASDSGPRRDPNGVTGISPFWEAVKKGDSAYVARDFDGAIAAYREAITKEPQKAAGHYRIGQAQMAKGDMKEAETAYTAAQRYVGADHTLKAKLLFVLSDLRERLKSYDAANEAWTNYETFAKQQPQAKAFPATATERKKRVTDYKKLLTDYGEVKLRIEKRLKEADDKFRKSAQ